METALGKTAGGKSALDKTAFEIDNGKVYIFGYAYCVDEDDALYGYRIVEYAGEFEFSLDDIIQHGLRNLEDKYGPDRKQYVTECGMCEAEDFYAFCKPITQEELNNLDFSDGLYYI